jgi:hypothetical protein
MIFTGKYQTTTEENEISIIQKPQETIQTYYSKDSSFFLEEGGCLFVFVDFEVEKVLNCSDPKKLSPPQAATSP